MGALGGTRDQCRNTSYWLSSIEASDEDEEDGNDVAETSQTVI